MRLSIFIALLHLALFSSAQESLPDSGPDKVEKDGITIELIHAADAKGVLGEETAVLTFNGHKGIYFADDVTTFLVDFSWSDVPQDQNVASMRVTINNTEFDLKAQQMFVIRGLTPGEKEMKVTLLNKDGDEIPFLTSGGSIGFKYVETEPLIKNDAVVLGLFLLILAFIFHTSGKQTGPWKKFYTFIPALFLCYFVPAGLNTLGVISADVSGLYGMAKYFLLPASLVLLCIGIDMKAILGLGPKALIMFLAGTTGVMIGGPIALMIVSGMWPEYAGGLEHEQVWTGLSTLAGSWIGGGANQTAMKEMFETPPDLFSATVAVDIFVANVWMAFILYGAGKAAKLDRWFKADSSAIEELKKKVEDYRASIAKTPTLTLVIIIAAVGFGVTGVGHLFADFLAPIFDEIEWAREISLNSKLFWVIVVSTAIGFSLSFTRTRELEGAGASRIGSAFLYILVMTIGMNMDIMAIKDSPGLFLIGGIWILIHVIILLGVGKLIKAPFFFVAVGSQANIGGAASAPVVASAFSPSLAPVGVLLAVFGYFVGTYGAYFCALMMKWVT